MRRDVEGNGFALIVATIWAGARSVCGKLRKTCVTIACLHVQAKIWIQVIPNKTQQYYPEGRYS